MRVFSCAFALVASLAFMDCPDSPNCVSSLAKDPDKRVKPFSYTNHTLPQAQNALLKAIKTLARSKIVKKEETHIKATVTSFVFGFVDDLYFVFDDENKLIHIRSASRTGYWDLGVNAKRVEELRKIFLRKLRE